MLSFTFQVYLIYYMPKYLGLVFWLVKFNSFRESLACPSLYESCKKWIRHIGLRWLFCFLSLIHLRIVYILAKLPSSPIFKPLLSLLNYVWEILSLAMACNRLRSLFPTFHTLSFTHKALWPSWCFYT